MYFTNKRKNKEENESNNNKKKEKTFPPSCPALRFLNCHIL